MTAGQSATRALYYRISRPLLYLPRTTTNLSTPSPMHHQHQPQHSFTLAHHHITILAFYLLATPSTPTFHPHSPIYHQSLHSISLAPPPTQELDLPNTTITNPSNPSLTPKPGVKAQMAEPPPTPAFYLPRLTANPSILPPSPHHQPLQSASLVPPPSPAPHLPRNHHHVFNYPDPTSTQLHRYSRYIIGRAFPGVTKSG
ncbi:extensin-like [Penaeus chinensis]|uniref:extensin-like n=1 Tax=Penaeus chinensis TaxID=139456 RepID=UPI001FB5DF62|nr:extensin-like [Penaeus chinensis]